MLHAGNYIDDISIRSGTAETDLIATALDAADLNALRVALYQATKNPALAVMGIERRPVRNGAAIETTVAPKDQPILKRLAMDFLLHRHEWTPPEELPPERLRILMELVTGRSLSDDEFTMGLEELAMEEFPRPVEWSEQRPDAKLDAFNVVIVGAGISGLSAAIQMERLGIRYTVVERQMGVGGTWYRNRYPDIRVDSPCVGYQYKFVKDFRWSEYYPGGPEVAEYLRQVADRHGVSRNMRFGLELKSARWDAAQGIWDLGFEDGAGNSEKLRASILVTACGLFNLPKPLDVPGIELYEGRVVHPSGWRQDIEVNGKRVALVGNGSTGVQLMPRLAEMAEHLTVYQRTPSWIRPNDAYRRKIAPASNWLLDNMPYYWNWQIFSNLMGGDSRLFSSAQKYDPEWQRKGGVISEQNDSLRAWLTSYIGSRMRSRPDLIEKLVPSYAPLGRRLVVDSGFYDALLRDNVELVTEDIERFTGKGIVTSDAVERKFDLVVSATGYKVMAYLWPADIVGRGSIRLGDVWADCGPQAYLGMVIPGFPNLFIMYGPNGQPRAGNFHSWAEVCARYIGQAIVHLVETGSRSIEVRGDICASYNARMAEEFKKIIWTTEAANGYFAVESGRGAVSMPWEHYEYHAMVRQIDLSDYVVN